MSERDAGSLDSRVVLHGWFEYPELTLSEALQSQKSRAALQLVLGHLGSRLREIDSVTGLLTVRVEVDGDGGVREGRPLSNTLVSTGGNPLALARCGLVLETVTDRRLPTDGKGAGRYCHSGCRMAADRPWPRGALT